MKYIALIVWCAMLAINPFLEDSYNIMATQLELFYVCFMMGYFGLILTKKQLKFTSIAVCGYYLYVLISDPFIDYLTPYYNNFEVGVLFLVAMNLLKIED